MMKATQKKVSRVLALIAISTVTFCAQASFVVDPADDDLALWLNASAADSVVTGVISGGISNDSADFSSGGGAAGDGDPVAWWRDQRTPTETNTGNGKNKNSLYYSVNNSSSNLADTGVRPTYVEDAYKGSPAIRFDGVDDFLITVEGAAPTLTEDHTIIVVGKAYSDSMGNYDNGAYLTYDRFLGNRDPSVGLDIMNTTADEGLRFRIKEPGLDTWSASSTLLEDVDVLMQRRTDNGDTTYTVDGLVGGGDYGDPNQVIVSGTSTGAIGDYEKGFRIAQHSGGGTQYLEADVFEILVYNRALTDDEMTSLTQSLYTTWSIPEPGSLALLALGGAALLYRRR